MVVTSLIQLGLGLPSSDDKAGGLLLELAALARADVSCSSSRHREPFARDRFGRGSA